jgi:hypothetical protein
MARDYSEFYLLGPIGKKSQINNWTEKIQAVESFWPGYQLRQQKKLSGLG